MKKYLLIIPFVLLSVWAWCGMTSLGGGIAITSEPLTINGAPTSNNLLIDATEEKLSATFPVVGSKTFRRFGFTCGTITVGGTLDVRLETAGVLGTSSTRAQAPSGVLACVNSSTTITLSTGNTNSYKETGNLPSDCTINNSTVAIVINDAAGVFQGDFPRYVNLRQDYVVSYSSNSSAGYSNNIPGPIFIAPVDSTGSYMNIPGLLCFSSVTTNTVGSGSSPNTYGNIINLPFRHRIIGASYITNLTGPIYLKIWNTDATLLESVFISSASSQLANQRAIATFSTSYTFNANVSYRISITPVTATTMSIYSVAWPNTTYMSQVAPGGTSMYYTSSTNPTNEASWTQRTNERVDIFPVIDQIDVNTGNFTPFLQ